MEEVEDLVVSPFREVAEKGKAALENAGDANPIMLKASQSLVKEGERALKRIEPLCRKHLEEYGHVFIASLKDNGAYMLSDNYTAAHGPQK
jgi:galactokinase